MITRENCDDKMDKFLKHCFYQTGQYSSEEDFEKLNAELKIHEVLTVFVKNFCLCISISR